MLTRLKEVRKAANYDQREAAEALGVSIGTYRNWEQGRVVMNGEQLIRAAELFETTVDHILMTEVAAIGENSEQQELLELYKSMDTTGRKATIAVVRALAEEFAK